ncbi:MAG TPA: hypothetical protein VLJ76_10465, partial [Gaiellaceae bacterium]|nr:hypothetical protein [Gaiellaceae bacterium]
FPLWASYPDALGRPREKALFVGGFALATLVAFSVLFLEPNPLHAAHVFYTRTFTFQLGRESPFSLWDWRQYHAGLPDLHVLQHVLQGLLIAAAVVLPFWPRRKTPLQLAALSAALLLGFEVVLTHWFYAYIVWFFPLFAFAAFSPAAEPVAVEAPESHGRAARELVTAS